MLAWLPGGVGFSPGLRVRVPGSTTGPLVRGLRWVDRAWRVFCLVAPQPALVGTPHYHPPSASEVVIPGVFLALGAVTAQSAFRRRSQQGVRTLRFLA